MKCDLCDNDATVHEVTVRNGVKIEKHLCESCAGQQGIAIQPQVSLPEVLKNYMSQAGINVGGASGATSGSNIAKAPVCPTCRTTFAEFKQTGLMGCPDCYRAFEQPLTPLLERAHDSAARHTGKHPKRMMAGAKAADEARMVLLQQLEERSRRLQALKAELDSAVRAEQYERAAELRDELKKLQEPGTGGKQAAQ